MKDKHAILYLWSFVWFARYDCVLKKSSQGSAIDFLFLFNSIFLHDAN